jgi:hypothetical protein
LSGESGLSGIEATLKNREAGLGLPDGDITSVLIFM